MLRVWMVALLLTAWAAGDVISGTSYYDVCVDFDDFIEDCGVYHARTKIVWKNGGYQYVAYFSESYDLDDDWAEVFAVAISAGYASRNTSWTSTGCVCVYNDKVVAITTYACRDMVGAWEVGYSMADLFDYYLVHSVVANRSTTNW